MYNRVSFSTNGVDFFYSYSKYPSYGILHNHCHSQYEIVYFVSGEGKFYCEGNSSEIKPGGLLLLAPMEFHYIDPGLDTPLEYYTITFTDDSVIDEARCVLKEILRSGVGGYYSFHSGAEGMISLFSRFEAAQGMEEDTRAIYTKLLISELALLLKATEKNTSDKNERELGVRVIKYLSENIDLNIDLDYLARRFFVSKYYLCRAFKKSNGISVHAYVNQKRLSYAKQLIENGESAASAAYKVGFGDYSAFYRAFVKKFGISPAKVKESYL